MRRGDRIFLYSACIPPVTASDSMNGCPLNPDGSRRDFVRSIGDGLKINYL